MKSKYVLFFLFLSFINLDAAVYKAFPLSYLSNDLPSEFEYISFDYKIFNKSDCKKYLGRDKILSKGYLPIQISINNNSDRTFSFSLNNFDINCISYEEVAQAVHFNMPARVIGWTLGGLFIWPLLIGAVVEGIQTPDANINLDIDYAQKSLKNQYIKPDDSINGLIFVERNQIDKNFSFILTDVHTNEHFELSTINQELDL